MRWKPRGRTWIRKRRMGYQPDRASGRVEVARAGPERKLEELF